jgi:acetyl esterase/lipase
MHEIHNQPPLDEGMLRFYEKLTAASPPEAVSWPLEKQRKSWDDVCKSFAAPLPSGLQTQDLRVPRKEGGVKIRLYRPVPEKLRPGVLYMHGGGWVLGSIETHDDMCAEMAKAADVVVAAVDYRLAPEHPHPAQLEDNLAVLAWMRREGAVHGIDGRSIVAAGDSAGGQMSASLSLYLRDKGLDQLKGQVLIYPVLGFDLKTSSYERNAHAPCLTREEMIFYWESVLGTRTESARRDKYIIPLLENDFSRLPPAFITAAGYDPLHDEAVTYGRKLEAAGVQVKVRREPNLAHSYMRARHVSATCKAGFDAICSAIRSLAHKGRL